MIENTNVKWIEEPLKNVLETLESGTRPKGGVRDISEGIPSVGGEHLNASGGFTFDHIKYVPKDFFRSMNRGKIQKYDVLVVKDGATTGKTSFVDERFQFDGAAVNEHVFILRAKKTLNAKYLFYYLFSDYGQRQIHDCVTGSAQGGINLNIGKRVLIRYPLSKPYQTVVVSEIEKQFTRLDAAVASLRATKDRLQQYRQSVLKAAFEGKLTGSKRSDWGLGTVKSVSKSVDYGTSQKAHSEGNVPVLRMGNLEQGRVTYENLKYYDKPPEKKLLLEDRDVLFNRTNSPELVGKTSIYLEIEHEFEQVTFASYLIRVRLNEEIMLPMFFNYWMNSPEARFTLEKLKSQQVGQANINGTKLKSIQLPVPPLPVQTSIVNAIQEKLSLTDNLNKTLGLSVDKVESLRKSILKAAFSGKLVRGESQ